MRVGGVLEELKKIAVQHHDDLPCLPAAVRQCVGELKRNSQATKRLTLPLSGGRNHRLRVLRRRTLISK